MLWTLLLSVLSLESCRNDVDLEDLRYPVNETQQRFEEEFTYMFGEVSPDVSWMTARRNEVTVDLSKFKSGESYKVQFFTDDPHFRYNYCYLVAEHTGVKGGQKEKLDYDYPTGLKNMFVSVIAADGRNYTQRIRTEEDRTETVTFDPDRNEDKILEHEPMRYRIGYEGFIEEGKRLDFDYNDVVAELVYVKGEPTATVNVLAVGCECAAQIKYLRIKNGKENWETVIEEAHASMGIRGIYDYVVGYVTYVNLNTDKNFSQTIGTATFDLKDDAGKSVTDIAPRLYVDFTLKPDKEGKGETTSSSVPQRSGVQYPQGVLVADPNWQWVDEGIRLSAKYAGYGDFYNWMLDPASYPFWYKCLAWEELNNRFK